ncbi:hypothetical protein BKA63DRAFT_598335 [Paraphoma chrysanthemicola]|nr:hypothetical protein BKA63DRAFT_598335 [Paraphoma chrysanthemicola]
MPKIPWLHHNWRHMQNSFTTKIFGSDAPIFGRPKNDAPAERMLQWFRSEERQHYGAKSRSPDLFRREDMIFFALERGFSHKPASPPKVYHNLLDAAARVGTLEQRIGYTFSDKMTCIEALKLTEIPLYYDGTIYDRGRNNRLALLGDRVLSLALCEIWFHTEHTTKGYNDMAAQTVSRVALGMTGRRLRLNESMLSFSRYRESPRFSNAMAETLEAVLGAVYVDSKYSIPAVKKVLRHVRLVDHQYLKTRDELAEAGTSPTVFPDQTASSGIHPGNPVRTSLEPSLQMKKHDEKAAKLPSATNGLKQLESQPQGIEGVGKSMKGLSSTNALNQASTPYQSSTSMRKELELLKRYAQEPPRFLQSPRKEAALVALHKHAVLSRRGIEVRPLELFEKARKGEGDGSEVARAEDPATNAPIAPRQPDGRARALIFQLSLKEKQFVDALKILARRDIDRGWRKEVARRALQRYHTLLKDGKSTQPVNVFQEIKDQIDIERGLVGEPKRQPHELAQATIVEASTLPRQGRITSAVSRRHLPTLNASGVQDQDSINTANQTGGPQDNGIFCESEIDVAGFLTFENALPESSRPSKSSNLRINTPG